MKKLGKISINIFLIGLVLFSNVSHARLRHYEYDCSDFTSTIEGGQTPYIHELVCVLIRIVNVGMLVVGGVFVLYVVYGAIKGAMAYGDPKQLKGAYNTWTFAVIGMMVVFFSLFIIRLIFTAFGFSLGFDGILEQLSEYIEVLSHPDANDALIDFWPKLP